MSYISYFFNRLGYSLWYITHHKSPCTHPFVLKRNTNK